MMTLERFDELAKAGYNRIPVTREVLADLDTPLSTYLKQYKVGDIVDVVANGAVQKGMP